MFEDRRLFGVLHRHESRLAAIGGWVAVGGVAVGGVAAGRPIVAAAVSESGVGKTVTHRYTSTGSLVSQVNRNPVQPLMESPT